MRVLWSAVVAATLWASLGAAAQVSEAKLTLEKLPLAVRQAVKAQGPGATVRGLAKEIKDGVASYEAELTVDGRTRDIIFDADGKILTMEEQKTLAEIPEPASAVISRTVGTGKLVMVEKVTQGEKTFYEGHISKGGTVSEVKVDAQGKPVE